MENQFFENEGYEQEGGLSRKGIFISYVKSLCVLALFLIPVLVFGKERMAWTNYVSYRIRFVIVFPILFVMNYCLIKSIFFIVQTFEKLDRCLQYVIEL
jgi:uncharacterized membrane protein YbhN (UPF0104 family)